MAKFSGCIGFQLDQVETAPGVWENSIVSRHYTGDIIRNGKHWNTGEGLNDDLTLSNQISIICDPFASKHVADIKYVEWMGTRWKVSSIDVQPPRLNLSLGGVYNG